MPGNMEQRTVPWRGINVPRKFLVRMALTCSLAALTSFGNSMVQTCGGLLVSQSASLLAGAENIPRRTAAHARDGVGVLCSRVPGASPGHGDDGRWTYETAC